MPYGLEFLREDLDKVDLFEDYHDVIPSAGNWSKLDDSDELRREGNELYEQEKYEEAYEIYSRALKVLPMAKRIPVSFVRPDVPQIHAFMLRCQDLAAKCFNNMAACILADKKAESKSKKVYSNATDLCNLALMLDPENVKAKYRLGLSAYFRGEYQDAIEIFEELQESDSFSEGRGQLVKYLNLSRQNLLGQQNFEKDLEEIHRSQSQAYECLKRNRFKEATRLLCRNAMYIEKLYLSMHKMDSVTKKEVFRLTMKYRFEISDVLIDIMKKDPRIYAKIFEKEWDNFLEKNKPGAKKILSVVLISQLRLGYRFDLPEIITEKAKSLIRASENDDDPLDEDTVRHIELNVMVYFLIDQSKKRHEERF